MSKFQHIGSIYEVASCIGYLIKPLIGHSGCVKIVTAEEGRQLRYFRDGGSLLRNLEIKHPVGQYMLNVSQAFHNHYLTGDDTLLYFMYIWIAVATELVQMGIEIDCVLSLMETVLEECIQHMETMKITLDDILKAGVNQRGDLRDTHQSSNHLEPCDSRQLVSLPCEPGSEQDSECVIQNFPHTSGDMLPRSSININNGNTENDKSSVTSDMTHGNEAHMLDILVDGKKKDQMFQTVQHVRNPVAAPKLTCNDSEIGDLPKDVVGTLVDAQEKNEVKSFAFDELTKHLEKGNFMDPDYTTYPNDKDSSAEIIQLKMKTSEANQEDDFEWFFENEEEKCSLTAVNQISNNESCESKCNIEGKLERLFHKNEQFIGSLEDDDIISEIKTLKQDIKNDIEQIKQCQKKHIERRVKEQDNTQVKQMFDGAQDFEDLLSNSDDDFDIEFVNGARKEDLEEDFTDVQITFSENSKCQTNQTDPMHLSRKKLISTKNENEQGHYKIKQRKTFPENKQIGLATFEMQQYKLATCSLSSKTLTQSHVVPTVKSLADNDVPTVNAGSNSSMNEIQKMNVLLKNLKTGATNTIKMPTQCYSRHVGEFDNVGLEAESNSFHSPDLQGGRLTVTQVDQVQSSRHRQENSLTQETVREKESDTVDTQCMDNLNTLEMCQLTETSTCSLNGLCDENCHEGTEQLMTLDTVCTDDDRIVEARQSQIYTHPADLESTGVLLSKQSNNLKLKDLNKMLENVHSLTAPIGGSNLARKTQLTIKSRHFLLETNENCNRNDADDSLDLDCGNLNRTVPIKNKKSEQIQIDRTSNSDIVKEPTFEQMSMITETENMQTDNVIETDMSRAAVNITSCEEEDGCQRAVREIISRLNPGVHHQVLDVVTELLQQKISNSEGEPWYTEVYSCERACRRPVLVDGVVLLTSIDNVQMLHQKRNRTCRMLLVNGDIRPSYRHKGYKAVKSTTVLTAESLLHHVTPGQQWFIDTQRVLTKLKIDVVLAKGLISTEFKDMCSQFNTVVMETIPYKYLKQLSDAAQREMLTYVSLATEENVVEDVTISPMKPDWSDMNVFSHSSSQQLEVLVTIHNKHLKTIMITEPSDTLADLKEQEVWQSVHRADAVLASHLLTPGGGHTEDCCAAMCRLAAEGLRTNTNTVEDTHSLDKLVVYSSMEKSFMAYRDLVQNNLNFVHSPTDCLYDDYTSKAASWRTALEAVKVIMKMDAHIVTGITETHKQGKSVL